MESDKGTPATPQNDFPSLDSQVVELLSAYVDGELTGSELTEAETYLAENEEARQWVAELRTLTTLVQSLPKRSPVPAFREKVLAQVLEETNRKPKDRFSSQTSPLGNATGRWLRRWLWSGMALAAMLLLMFLQSTAPENEQEIAQVKIRSEAPSFVEKKAEVESAGSQRFVESDGVVSFKENPGLKELPREKPTGKTEETTPVLGRSRYQVSARGRNWPQKLGTPLSSQVNSPADPKADSANPDLRVQIVFTQLGYDVAWFRQWLIDQGAKPVGIKGGGSVTLANNAPEVNLDGKDLVASNPAPKRLGQLLVEVMPNRLQELLQACQKGPGFQARISPALEDLKRLSDLSVSPRQTAGRPKKKVTLNKKQDDIDPSSQHFLERQKSKRAPMRLLFELKEWVPSKKS